VILGGLVYGGAVLMMFGRQWLAVFRRRMQPPGSQLPSSDE
jgi:hypothetical protein